MSVQVLQRTTARRSLCNWCLLSRCTKAHYSQSAQALSLVPGRIQDSEGCMSTSAGRRTRTATYSDSHHAVANARDPLDPTRLDRYLASIRAVDLEPTLDDVERCKPASLPQPDSPRYAMEYTNLLEMLCRSFSKDQLRRFTELYRLDPIWTRSSRRKTEYAESIIEKAWCWPSLKEIERKRRDTTEVLVRSFTVTPSQLFLIMGKDGADLLQLSTQYNVHISLISSPLSLRVEGLRGSLKSLSEYISCLKKGLIDEIFELPTGRPVRSDLLQRISRLSGAYVENHGNRGKVRICAKDDSDITAAKQLALRASLEVGTQAPTVCYDPPYKAKDFPIANSEPHMYSVYPFVTPCPFPWTMHSNDAFRLRRVADWLGINSYEDVASSGGLADNPHCLLNLNQTRGGLSQLVYPTMPESAPYRQRIISASFGHVLLSSVDKPQRASLFSPLRSTLSLPEILKWVETSGTPLNFVPSFPPAVMTATVGKRRCFRRLIYRTLPEIVDRVSESLQHVLKFEVELSDFQSTSVQVAQDFRNKKFADVLSSDGLNSITDTFSSRESVPLPSNLLEASDNGPNSNCQVGSETYINLMLPDRPVDLQLCVFTYDDVSLAQRPQVLREYANRLRDSVTNADHLTQLDPPLTFSFEGRTFYLHDSLTVRQNDDLVLLPTTNDYLTETGVEVCNERIMDLQSTQEMELCQVKFSGAAEGSSWKHFLAMCDQLSMVPSESRSKKDNLRAVYLDK